MLEKIKSVIREMIEHDEHVKLEAFKFVDDFTRTSTTKLPSNEAIEFLRQYPTRITKPLYRGIGLVRQKVNRENIREINLLKPGDSLPSYLARQTGVSSYTKKKSVAKYYANGEKSLIVEVVPNLDSIILDLESFAKQIIKDGETYFSKSKIDYMLDDKEVIVVEPVEATVIYAKGKIS
jgi:hypothetical protein